MRKQSTKHVQISRPLPDRSSWALEGDGHPQHVATTISDSHGEAGVDYTLITKSASQITHINTASQGNRDDEDTIDLESDEDPIAICHQSLADRLHRIEAENSARALNASPATEHPEHHPAQPELVDMNKRLGELPLREHRGRDGRRGSYNKSEDYHKQPHH